jgi:single-strand DNA-binding protein
MNDNDNLIFIDGYISDIVKVDDTNTWVYVVTYELDKDDDEAIENIHKLVFENQLSDLADEYLEIGRQIGVSGSLSAAIEEEEEKHILVDRLFFGTQNIIKIVGYVGVIDEKKNNVVRLRIATHDIYKSKGNKVEETDWHTVVCFSGVATTVKEYIKVGDLISVKGKLKTKEFNNKISSEIYAESIKLKRRKEKNED